MLNKLTKYYVPAIALIILSCFATADVYRVGWYDVEADDNLLYTVASSGATVMIAYYNTAVESDIEAYLEKANQAGITVFVDIRGRGVNTADWAQLQTFVSTYTDNPAVEGWYLADEPIVLASPLPISQYETAYSKIKEVSSKPVVITFTAGQFSNGNANAYSNAYDWAFADDYPCHKGTAEYSEMPGFINRINLVKSNAQLVSKPLWYVLQGFGDATGSWNWRLPTYGETEFMFYWSIVNDIEGLLYWAYYRAEQTPAEASEVYPFSGEVWLENVWKELAGEFYPMRDAVGNGKVPNGVTSDNSNVKARVYQDPEGSYYLIFVNGSDSTQNVTLNFTLTGDINIATEINDKGLNYIDISQTGLSESVEAYGVKIYKLSEYICDESAAPEYDINGDCMVNLKDLSMIAISWLFGS